MHGHVQRAFVDMTLDDPVHRFQMVDNKRAFDTGVVGDHIDVWAIRVSFGGLHEQVQHNGTVLAA